jgi:hypothetical protein
VTGNPKAFAWLVALTVPLEALRLQLFGGQASCIEPDLKQGPYCTQSR